MGENRPGKLEAIGAGYDRDRVLGTSAVRSRQHRRAESTVVADALRQLDVEGGDRLVYLANDDGSVRIERLEADHD